MTTLEKSRVPENRATKTRPKTRIASALAGKPIQLPRTSELDLVIEKPLFTHRTLLEHLTGYNRPSESQVIKALRGGAGTKIGTALGGGQALRVLLAAREVNGDLTLRITDSTIHVGDQVEPDLRLASITMMGCARFDEDDAWQLCELAGYDETPEQMTERITRHAWEIVNVIEHVPLPVAAAAKDLLKVAGYSNVTVRQAVPRRK